MKRFSIIIGIILYLGSGCGYSARSALPGGAKSIHVDNIKNSIDYTSDQADRARNIYLPLLEVKIRNAIVDRFLFDGNLRIQEADIANLFLKGELVNYQRIALRYTDNNDVEEYRVQIIVNLVLSDQKQDEVIWEEKGFTGEATYFVSGPSARSETAAVEEATVDLARRIVERTIENW